jgi:hypothetical protein
MGEQVSYAEVMGLLIEAKGPGLRSLFRRERCGFPDEVRSVEIAG